MDKHVHYVALLGADKKTVVDMFPLTLRDETHPFSSGSLGYAAAGQTLLADGEVYQVSVNVTLRGSKSTERAALAADIKRMQADDREKRTSPTLRDRVAAERAARIT